MTFRSGSVVNVPMPTGGLEGVQVIELESQRKVSVTLKSGDLVKAKFTE
jgi:hypothetical protein